MALYNCIAFNVSVSPVFYVAADTISVCTIGNCDEKFFPSDFGLHELRCHAQQGHVKFGDRAVVVCVLGRADIMRGRPFITVLRKFLQACKVLASTTYFVFLGPFPHPRDGSVILRRLADARELIRQETKDEDLFICSSIADRFADPERGINPRLMWDEGLTIRGCEILRREVNHLIQEISFL